jgi:hypothetical protein
MDATFHRLCELFRQLGLPDEPAAVDRFIATHRPLAAGTPLCDAPFWTPSQAQFLREQIHADADWAEVVDGLSARLAA